MEESTNVLYCSNNKIYQLGNLPNCLINLYCLNNLINLEELKVNYPNLKVE
jgi:hypothetical protein